MNLIMNQLRKFMADGRRVKGEGKENANEDEKGLYVRSKLKT